MIRTITKARLNVTLPSGTWAADISSRHPSASFDVQAALTNDDVGFVLVEITAEHIEEVLEALIAHSEISETGIVQESDREAAVQLETPALALLVAAKRGGIPIEMPIRISNGIAIAELAGAHDRYSAFIEHLDSLGVTFNVECVERRCQPDQLLTDTQREVLAAAVELGYYETPRDCTQEELAEALGIAKSTCSGVLHRAEAAIVNDHIGTLPTTFEDDPERLTHRAPHS